MCIFFHAYISVDRFSGLLLLFRLCALSQFRKHWVSWVLCEEVVNWTIMSKILLLLIVCWSFIWRDQYKNCLKDRTLVAIFLSVVMGSFPNVFYVMMWKCCCLERFFEVAVFYSCNPLSWQFSSELFPHNLSLQVLFVLTLQWNLKKVGVVKEMYKVVK